MPEIAPTNPYDPATPVEQQKKGQISLFVKATSHENTDARPLSDAEIRLADGPSQSGSEDVTDESGRLDFVDLAPGTYQFYIWHPEFGPPRPGQSHWVTIEPGETKESDVFLAPVGPTDSSGLPIAFTLSGIAHKAGQLVISEVSEQDHSGIIIRVRTEDETPTSIEATSNRDGSFGLALNPGSYKLYFDAPDHLETGPVTATVSEGAQTNLEEPIVLDVNPGRISGKILVEGLSDGEFGEVLVSLSNTSFTALTNESGEFQLTSLPAGAYQLRAVKDGYSTLSVPSVIVAGGQLTDLGELALNQSRGSLNGHFQLAGMQTSDGIQVSLANENGRLIASSLTDANGMFQFSEIPVGQYRISACKQGFLPPNGLDNIAISANSARELETVIVSRPTIDLFQFSDEVRTNNRNWRLRFNVPTERLTSIRVTGDITRLDSSGSPISDQDSFAPFQTEGGESFVDLELADREGALLINVTFRGDDCYLSDTYNLVVNLDRVGPTLLETSIGTGTYTNTRVVPVQIIGFGAEEMRIEGSGVEAVGGTADNRSTWITASSEILVQLNGGDGDKVIEITTRDRAGNESITLSETVILDTLAPTNAKITFINAKTDPETEASYTTESLVNLELSASDPPADAMEMRIANDPTFIGANWEPLRRQTNWQLQDPQIDGIKTVYAQIRDAAGNSSEPEEVVSASIELDRLGAIDLGVTLKSPVDTAVTDATVYLDGTAVGNPDVNGELTLGDVPIGIHELTASLPNHTLLEAVTVSVEARQTTPKNPVLQLNYNTGFIQAEVALEGSDICPTVDDLNGANLQLSRSGTFIDDLEISRETCFLQAEVPIGLEQTTLTYPGFQKFSTIAEVSSAQILDLGSVRLARATGTITGIVELQGVSRFSGIQIEVVPVNDPELPTYTGTTAADGGYTLGAVWAGSYHVWAEKEGYNRKRIGENILVVENQTTVTTDDADVLSQQTGDFLINGGNTFTNTPEVSLQLSFSDITEFRVRTNGGAFGDWIPWNDDDQDGIMTYGLNGEVTLNAISDTADTGDRLVEIETKNLEGVSSGAPYFQASIRLDTVAPVGTKLEFVGAGITNDQNTVYSNASLGEVTLDLLAEDANWDPDIAGVSRVRLSGQDNCQAPQEVCEPGTPPHECDSRLWTPLMTYELPDRQTDGIKDVYACFIDPAGNTSEPMHASILLDRTPPEITNVQVIDAFGELCNAQDPCFVNQRDVEVRITENFDSAIIAADARASWTVVNDPNFLTGGWTAYAPEPGNNEGTVSVTLPSQDSTYTLYLKAKDAAENVSESHSINVQLDTQAPAKPQILEPSQYVSQHEIEINFTNIAAETSIEHSWDGSFTDVGAEDYVDLVSRIVFDFPTDEEGPRTLYLRYRDAANNPSDVTTVEVFYDNTAPVINNVRLNFGENTAPTGMTLLNSPTGVPLEVQCDDRVCSEGVCKGSSPETLTLRVTQTTAGQPNFQLYDGPYASLITVDIANRLGVSGLSVICVDPAGNVSATRQTNLLLDTVSPVATDFSINDGQPYTQSINVNLELSVSDGPGSGIAEMAVSNGTIDCDTANFFSYRPNLSWTLPTGDGQVTVSACIKDRAGNLNDLPIEATIILDTTPPTGSITHVGESEYSLTENATFLVRRNNADAVEFSIERGAGALCQNLNYQVLAANTTEATLSLPEGPNEVSLCLKDAAGLTNKYITSVIVDTQDPSGFMTINQGNAFINDPNITINITKSDGVSEMKVAPNPSIDCTQNSGYAPISLAFTVPLAVDDGDHQISGCLRKPSGRWVKMDAVEFVLDTAPPTFTLGPVINLNAPITNDPTLVVQALADDATSSITEYILAANSSCTGAAWRLWSPMFQEQITVAGGDREERSISMQLKDRAGNESECVTRTIIVDNVAPNILNFAVAGGSVQDEPGFSSQLDIVVTELSTDDVNHCQSFQVSETPGFNNPTTYNDCNGAPYTFTLREGPDGRRAIFARAIDDAGNASTTAQTTIELDRGAPTISSVELIRGENSSEIGPKYTNQRDVIVRLSGAAGASEIRYCALEDGTGQCGDGSFSNGLSFSNEFSVRFLSDGLKRVCVRLFDVVGNQSIEDVCDEITIDTVAPPPPSLPKPSLSGVNASCAYIEAERVDVTDFDHFEFRSLGGQWRELSAASQDPNNIFDAEDLTSTAQIKFNLAQDSNNLLQIRIVDKAGNPSDPSTAVVDEVSTFFTPTNLRIKQVCDGGRYAILKEQTQTAPSVRYSNCMASGLYFQDLPETAIFDIAERNEIPLSATLTVGDLSTGTCEFENLSKSVIDAACSAEPDSPELLIVRPFDPEGVVACPNYSSTACFDYFQTLRNAGTPGSIELMVMPSPIDDPHQQLVPINTTSTAIRSIEALDWRGDRSLGEYSFRLLATHSNKYYNTDLRFPAMEPSTYVSEMEWTYSRTTLLPITTQINVGQVEQPSFPGFTSTIPSQALAKYGDWAAYLRWDDITSRWVLARVQPTISATDYVIGPYKSTDTDIALSPMNRDVKPAAWPHAIGAGAIVEARGNFVYLRDYGDDSLPIHKAVAQRADLNDVVELGTNAPLGAKFFEVGLGQVWWVDVDEPSIIYQSTVYGENPITVRYPVDLTKPILPIRGGSLDLGEGYVMYHTSGISSGIVIAYLDENDESQFECAQ